MKILVIDDSYRHRAALAAYFSNTGHDVVLATDGRDGVLAFAQTDPDVVLLDLNMSDIASHEAAQQIRRAGDQWVPIVMLTNADETGEIAPGAPAETFDYLAKFSAPAVLDAKMQSVTRVAQMRRQIISRSKRLQEATDALERMADTDQLTGCANRRKLDARLDEEVRRGARSGKPLAVILMEIDHMQGFNGTHGRAGGDACIKQVAAILKAQLLRPADLVARYRGPSFCMLLPETAADGAEQVAERLRSQVAALTLALPRQTTFVTASFGVTAAVPAAHASAEAWLLSAEAALCAAQHKGRNTTHCEPIFLA